MKGLSLSRLARLGMVGLPCLGLACSQIQVTKPTVPNPMKSFPATPVDKAMSLALHNTPAANDSAVRAASAETRHQHLLQISLDTVLRLAEEQNPQIAAARSKVETAFSEKCLAEVRWVPDIDIGVGYYRHEGGIQLQEGQLTNSSTGAVYAGPQLEAKFNPREYAFRQIEAARKVWLNQGDLSKITYEQMLDASNTYIDLLAAYSAMAISQDLEKKVKVSVEKAIKQYESSMTLDVELEKIRCEAELNLQKQTQLKLQGQIEAAAHKLTYLLGLDSSTPIVPLDSQMAAFHIVDASQPTEHLVGQALASGPGVRELEGILGVIQAGLDTAKGPGRFVPIVQFQAGEGIFGAGPGSTMAWANRFDMAIQAKWNVSDLFLASRKRQVAMSQVNQANMSYAELQAKLTLGVQEARATTLASSAQFPSAEEMIKQTKSVAEKAKKLGDENMAGVTSHSVILAYKAVGLAQLNYVDLMREYDKAQIRLLVLTGSCPKATMPPPGANPPAKLPEK
jgi:outer membrane protein TolC